MQEAKNKLSEVVDTSISDGPQIINRRGKNTSVLMSFGQYQKLTGKKMDAKAALMALDLSDLDISRDKSSERATPFELDLRTS